MSLGYLTSPRLFTRWTAGLMLVFSALTTSRQFFGEPIHCHLDHGAISMKVFESYCWMSSTYTLLVDNREDNATLLHGAVGQAVLPLELTL